MFCKSNKKCEKGNKRDIRHLCNGYPKQTGSKCFTQKVIKSPLHLKKNMVHCGHDKKERQEMQYAND